MNERGEAMFTVLGKNSVATNIIAIGVIFVPIIAIVVGIVLLITAPLGSIDFVLSLF